MGSYSNRHPDNTPVVGDVRRITVGFDHDDYTQRKSALAPKYGGDLDPLTMRVLPKDPVVTIKQRNGLGGGLTSQDRGIPKGMAVLNRFGHAGETKYATLSGLGFLGLSTKEMQPHSVGANTGSNVAVDVQGHTWAWNRSDKPIRISDQIMWDIPEDDAEAEAISRVAGPPTNGAYPERRYVTYLKAYKPEDVVPKVRVDWQEYLNGAAPEFATTVGAVASVRQLVTIGVLIASTMIPGYIDEREQVAPENFAAIVKAVLSAAPDPTVVLPEGLDDAYQGVMQNILRDLMAGNLDQHISAMLTPRVEERVITGKRMPRDATRELRYINDIQKEGVNKLLLSVDNVHEEGGRSRVIGRALGSAMPGEDFSLIMYGK